MKDCDRRCLRDLYVELRGLRLDHNPQLPAELLMRQIQLREELEEFEEFEESTSALERLDRFKTRLNRKLDELGQLFAVTEYDEAALELVYEMQFLTKLLVAADQFEEKLLDY